MKAKTKKKKLKIRVWGWGIGKKHFVEFSSLRHDSWMCVRHKWVAGRRWCWNWRFKSVGRAGSFQEGFKHQSPQNQQINKLLLASISFTSRMMPQWPQTPISYPKFVFPVIPNLSSQLQHPEQEGWGQVLLCPSEVTCYSKQEQLPWDWLIDPNGNDSCPGLLTMTFNPVEKSIPPILAYLLFVKHSWLQVPVKISLAACHYFYVQGQINSLHPAVGSFLKKHIFPLFLQEKIH